MNKINWKLFSTQKLFLTVVLIIYLVASYTYNSVNKPHFKKSQLQIDPFSAPEERLISIPYIGQKNAKKILKLREKRKKIKLKELENLRFYEKFKYFLKTEN